jgi:hypothetical protein
VACGIGYGFIRTTVAIANARAESKRDKTILDERIASARKIRAILSKPQSPIEPLPPVTATLANPHPSQVVGLDNKRKPIRLPKEARDAFAMDSPGSYRSSYSSPDPGGAGGW